MMIAFNALVLTAVTATAQTDTLHIRFIGNAAFELTDGSTTLVTDFPYRSGASGYMRYEMDRVPLPADAVAVITHRHADHFDARLARRHGWRVVGPVDVTDQVDGDQVAGSGDTVTRIGVFTITPVRTPHLPEHFSYLITWRGTRLFFTGDTETPDVLLGASSLDVAFVTPWLLCTITRAGRRVPARQVVLHHQAPNEPSRGCGQPLVLEQGASFAIVADP